MSGFLALWDKTGGSLNFALEKTTAIMCHRGPDHFGSLISGPVSMGCRYLKQLIYLHRQTAFFNEKKMTCLGFDGRIYNYHNHAELLQRLFSAVKAMRK